MKTQIKFKKGTFIVIPNKQVIMGMSPTVQTIYFWICNFADENGACFPSRAKLAECAGVAIRSVERSIKELETIGILTKTKRFEDSKQTSNKYQILIAEEGATQCPTELNPLLTQSNELAEPSSADIVALIDLFKDINPAYSSWYKNKTQRLACKWLLGNYDPPELQRKIAFLPKINSMPYAPITTTPYQLQVNMSKIQAFLQQTRNKQHEKQRSKGKQIIT